MKRFLIRFAAGAVLLTAGFVCGRLVQHAKTGFHREIREQKIFESAMGPVQWSHVTESVGFPFLDPGTTILEFKGRAIYKAKRVFQEGHPFAWNVTTEGNLIRWEDGEYRFQLLVEDMGVREAGENENPLREAQERNSAQ